MLVFAAGRWATFSGRVPRSEACDFSPVTSERLSLLNQIKTPTH